MTSSSVLTSSQAKKSIDSAMSLSVSDPRARGRSKSPGRERSRSRDYRAPSPPEIRPKKSSKEASRKSSQKHYSDDDNDSGTRARKSTKKYYDDDSESGSGTKKPSKKYYDDDDDPHARSKGSKKYYEDESDSHHRSRASNKYRVDESESDRREKKYASRRYYDDRREHSSSESDTDRRRPSHGSAKPKYDDVEPKYRRGSSPDTHSTALARKPEYVQTSNPQFESDRYDGRHPSYATPERYEHGKPSDYTRHIGHGNEKSEVRSPGTSIPGQYKWEYDHPPAAVPEHSRHMSLNTAGPVNNNVGTGYASPTHYGHTVTSPLTAQYHPSPQRPENQRNHSGSVGSVNQYAYADPSHHITYTSKTDSRKPSYTQSAQPQFVEVKPNASALHTNSSEGLGSRLHRLSVSGGAAAAGALSLAAPGQNHAHMQGGLPPGSPLLEAYRGTYQSISPMPSPLMLPSTMDEGLSDLEPLSPQYSSDGSYSAKANAKKRVKFYDPEEDAMALGAALKHSHPDSGPIIQVLPRLSDDNVLQLRTEYKKHIKVNGKGINVAKHIKMKVSGNLGKIASAVALGRWESEAYWANFWYQSNSSRRELLIESLMGRSNSEIVKIKDAFRDKRYNDSLEKCMQTELKKDKFRNAVLLALDEKRMDETEKLSIDRVRRDVQDLYRALTAKEGGETAMINIIVVRSDNHLREVLRVFEDNYRKNFAREMIQKSRNLVVSLFFPYLSLSPFPNIFSHSHPNPNPFPIRAKP